jgi:PAS domain S-box-containing protein
MDDQLRKRVESVGGNGLRGAGPTVCPDAMVFVRPDGSVDAWDDAAREMFGRSPEEVVGLPFSALFAAGCRDDVQRLSLAPASYPLRLLATGVRKDGSRFQAEITSARVPGDGAGPTGFVDLVRDVTEPRVVEAAVAAVSDCLESSVAVASLGQALQPWLSFVYLALGVVKGRRYRRIVHTGSPVVRLVEGEIPRSEHSPLQAVLARRAPVVVQDTHFDSFAVDARFARVGVRSYAVMPLVRADSVFATLNVGFRCAGLPTARVVRLLHAVTAAVAGPVSKVLEFEEQSRAVRRLEERGQLEKVSRALITHDMRTPLAVIAGSASRLRETWDDLPEGEKLEGLDAIVRNGRNLVRLVEQELQLALVETGSRPLHISVFDLAAQIESVVGNFAGAAPERFGVRIQGPLAHVRGDERLSAQVLVNLLSNALKFSGPTAPVEIEVSQRGPMACVAVHDHGVGISGGDLAKLFRKFSRVGSADDPKVAGTGLGLYLSKCMVEAQGGRIWVESRRGEGSTFTYTVPVAATRASARRQLSAVPR